MTVTLPATPARPRRAAAILVAVAIAILGVFVAPAVADAAPNPAAIGLTLSPVGGGVVAQGEPFTASVTVVNRGTLELAPGLLGLEIADAPTTDRADLEAWLDGESSTATLPAVQTSTAVVEGRSTQTFGLIVPAVDPAPTDRAPGVYAVQAVYTVEGVTVTARSAMIIPDPDAPAVRVGVLVPITAGSTSTALLSSEELTALTAPQGVLSSQLDAVVGTEAILAVDPAIVASIRVLGSAAPESATQWLERLLALPNSRFALQFGDADVGVQLQAGLERPLAVRSLAFAMDPENFVSPTPTPAATPTPTTDPQDTPLPDDAELLDIGTARPNVYWPAPGTVDDDAVATLERTAPGSTAAVSILESAATIAGAEGATLSSRAAIGESGAPALLYDSGISAALAEAAGTTQGALRGASITEATALLALAAGDVGTGTILVTVGRETERSRVQLRSAITAVTEAPWVDAVTLGVLVQSAETPHTLAPVEPVAERVGATQAMLAGEASIEQFATILDDPNLLIGPERASILQLLGVGWIPQESAWSGAIAQHATDTQTTLNSVSILPSSTIQLLSPDSPLPFWIRNDLPYRANLVLFATPDDLRLDVQRATEVIAEPQSNTRVQVPVQARVGSGEVEIRLQLRSPASIAIGQEQVAEVQVRAEWEAYGITALVVVVSGLLVVGLIRTIRRRRRARAADAGADQEAGTGADADTERP